MICIEGVLRQFQMLNMPVNLTVDFVTADADAPNHFDGVGFAVMMTGPNDTVAISKVLSREDRYGGSLIGVGATLPEAFEELEATSRLVLTRQHADLAHREHLEELGFVFPEIVRS
jgi:hypothetical protein